MTALTLAEQSYNQALRAARKAIRAGDIALAERWVRIAERHTRLCDHRWAEEGKRLDIRRKQQRFDNWRGLNPDRADR